MLAFYKRLGFGVVGEDEWRAGKGLAVSVVSGPNKINLHAPALWQRPEFTLRAPASRPGCGDFCFVWDSDAESLATLLDEAGAAIEVGPVQRQGGRGGGTAMGTSFYTRDPDGNLLEFMVYS